MRGWSRRTKVIVLVLTITVVLLVAGEMTWSLMDQNKKDKAVDQCIDREVERNGLSPSVRSGPLTSVVNFCVDAYG